MIRIALLIVSLVSLGGCEARKSSTAPTPVTTAVSAGEVKIHSFELGSVGPAVGDRVAVGFRYHATANYCVVFVFRGKTANTADLLGASEVDVFQKEWSTAILARKVPGEHLVELRCVHDQGAQTGAIEGRFVTIP